MTERKYINNNEETILRFKNLYKCFGYKQYKMSKFEEYDLYAENKNFLQNSNIITFTDLNGKLMALKPDVTLSIAKNVKDTAGTQKVYYSENVYRARKDGNEFKEIMQTGLECMDDIDLYSMGEVLMLAAKSLELISENYILDISHTGFVTELFKEIPESKREVLLSYVNAKNSIGIKKACAEFGLGVSLTEKAVKLASLYGPFDEVIMELKKLSINNNTDSVIDELEGIYNMLKVCGCEKNINIDFSIINDMSYYNGIVFKGYVAGIPSNILSGGRYDKLLQKLGKNAGAIGFALYLDMLDWLNADDEEYDADVLVINDGSQAADDVAKTVMEIVAEGETVSVLSKMPPNGRYKRIVRIDERGLRTLRQWIDVALPKGRLGENVYKIFDEAGYSCPSILETNRKLIFENEETRVRYFWVKPSDVAIYVERGAADIGVAGRDILLEYEPDVFELADLNMGKCRMCVAGHKGFRDNTARTLRVATKFPNITKTYYAEKSRQIDIIKLNGSIELAPILKMSDVIVDIVETGTTLKENNLEVLEEILPISARLISNKVSYKFKNNEIMGICDRINEICSVRE